MKERESVKKVYDEIHAPEALLRKVMEMNKKDFKFRNAVKFVAMAAAALVIKPPARAFMAMNPMFFSSHRLTSSISLSSER